MIHMTYGRIYCLVYHRAPILGPLFFSILLGDLFFKLNHKEIANYADDFAPYAVSDDIDDLMASLEKYLKDLLKWFDDNLRKSNPDKCHLLVSSREIT